MEEELEGRSIDWQSQRVLLVEDIVFYIPAEDVSDEFLVVGSLLGAFFG